MRPSASAGTLVLERGKTRSRLPAAWEGDKVGVVAYGNPHYPFAKVYRHDLVDEVTRGLGARLILLSADTREVVTGILSMGKESRTA